MFGKVTKGNDQNFKNVKSCLTDTLIQIPEMFLVGVSLW
jgi:hypothetical protein